MNNTPIWNKLKSKDLRLMGKKEFSNVQNLIMTTLTKDFLCIDYIYFNKNKKNGIAETFIANAELTRNIPEWEAELNFKNKLELIHEKIVPEEKEAFYKKTRCKVIVEQLNNIPEYHIVTKAIFDEEFRHIRVRFLGDWTDDRKLRGCVATISKLNEVSLQEIEYHEMIEKIVDIQAEEIRRKNLLQHKTNERIVSLLGDVVEGRHKSSGEHINRVKRYTYILAMQVMNDYPEYKLTENKINIITYVSPLHDIGKIAIPDTILLKPGKLTADEWEEMKTHSEKGCEILEKMAGAWDEDFMKTAMEISKYHHEKWDGKGYPMGLVGDEIPISAQIVSVADCLDALTSKRVYKDATDVDTAFRMILNGECGEFSEKMKNCLIKCKDTLTMAMASEGEFYVLQNKTPETASARKKLFKSMSILLVDNNDVSREINKTSIELEGATIMEAQSGYEAVDIVKQTHSFDLIIMNLNMPGMNGLETISTINHILQANETHVPIVAINEQINDEVIEQVIKAGGLGCLNKPLQISELYGFLLSRLMNKTSQIERRLEDTLKLAYTDPLTKVKNITAYTNKVEDLANDISQDRFTKFAIILCDINDLRIENDTFGHDMGNLYIKNCCQVICTVFAHSPVYRIGGDEFAVVLHDNDYNNRKDLMMQMKEEVNRLSKIPSSELGKAAFASGMAVYDPLHDTTVSDVIKRADAAMCAEKRRMKVGEFRE